MRDLASNISVVPAISPSAGVSDNTPSVSAIIDTQGFDSLMFAIATGVLADADATFAVTMDHGDASNLSDAAAVPASMLNGTLAAAGFTFAADGATRKIGYVGDKRYVRLTVTPSNNSGAAPICAVALRGHPANGPVA